MNTVLPLSRAPTRAISWLRIRPKCTGSVLWHLGQTRVVVCAPETGQTDRYRCRTSRNVCSWSPVEPKWVSCCGSGAGLAAFAVRPGAARAPELDLPFPEDLVAVRAR